MPKNKKLSKLDKYLLSIEWKPIHINSKQTCYQVSNNGFVKNLNTNTILNGSHDARGYVVVSIWLDDKMYTKKVHRLVAEAFIPNPDNKPTVNHKDGNKENNNIANLEWATHKENIDHAIQTGLRDLKGMNSSSNIYTDETVHRVCKMLEQRVSARDIADTLNVNINLPRRILYLGKWSHIATQYDIPKVTKVCLNIKGRAMDLMKHGITDYDELLELLDMEDTPKNRDYLRGVKWRFNKAQGSTTIKHSDVGGKTAS